MFYAQSTIVPGLGRTYEAKDRRRPALPQQNKSDVRQITGPKSFCRAFDHFGAANLKKKKEERERETETETESSFLLSHTNATPVDFPMLHGCVAVAGIPFASSQALRADCHKPEVRGQHTWAGRIADSTIQLPTQPTHSPFRRTKQLRQSARLEIVCAHPS